MSRIIPIPTTRVGDLFVRQRLIDQVQSDQLALFRLQNQVSTGQRIQLPSDDAPAALRAINLQRLLARSGQIRSNLQASNSYLGAAWDRLGSVSSALVDLRGAVIGVAGTVVPDSAIQAVIQEVDGVLRELVSAGNAKYQGRYLFAGSRSQVQPYEFNGKFVEFFGNEGALRSYVDLERLFDTNLTGPQVFGGVSAAVEGSVDLNPHVTSDTLLSTINGGAGLGRNPAVSISVNTGTATVTSIVNLAGAVTLGDVARMIETGAPPGTEVAVEVTGAGLVLRTTGNSISVGEVANGRTARELGIFKPAGTLPSFTGEDLNPAVLKTTRLSDLLGTKAQGRIESAGANNDIVITATDNGTEFNDVTVLFVGGGIAGNETVTYDDSDPLNKTLTVQVQSGVSTAAQVAARITAEGTFTAAVDYHDAITPGQAGSGAVQVTNFGVVTSGGGGQVLDKTSGLVLTNGGKTVTLDIGTAQTVEDLLNLISGAGLGLSAEINAAANGINVRSRLSGADFTIGESGGTTATQLGIRTYTGATALAALNRGLGVPTSSDPLDDDFVITGRDGTPLAINLSDANTIQDVLNLINNHADNNAGTTAISARLATHGNGIELVDSSVAVGDLTLEAVGTSRAAEFLGFLPAGQTQVIATVTDANGNSLLQSEDRHTLEADGIFNTLLRLRAALEARDVAEIGRSLERLDVDMNQVNFARAEVGVRLQNLQVIGIRLEDENVELRSALSQELDVDLVEAISNLTARQYAFEASLRTSANVMQLSLLNFI